MTERDLKGVAIISLLLSLIGMGLRELWILLSLVFTGQIQ
jgi:hypothetical protein